MSNKQAIEILQKLCNISEKEANEDPESMYKQGLREWFYIAKSRIQSIPPDDGWISAETPPDHIWEVLVIANWITDIASYEEMYDGWMYNDEIADDDVITHWQPLPLHPITK